MKSLEYLESKAFLQPAFIEKFVTLEHAKTALEINNKEHRIKKLENAYKITPAKEIKADIIKEQSEIENLMKS